MFQFFCYVVVPSRTSSFNCGYAFFMRIKCIEIVNHKAVAAAITVEATAKTIKINIFSAMSVFAFDCWGKNLNDDVKRH